MNLHHYDKDGRKHVYPHHDWRGAALVIGGLLVLLLIGAAGESLLLDGSTVDAWKLVGQAVSIILGALALMVWWWVKTTAYQEEAESEDDEPYDNDPSLGCPRCGR